MASGETGQVVQHRLKLAVALACIANKSDNQTGREYAQSLCDTFQRSQIQWKERFQEAQTEVLHLKQRLLLTKHNRNLELSQHATQDDAGSESLFPTPPTSGQPPTGTSSQITQQMVPHTSTADNSLNNNTAFLQALIQLQTASSAMPLKEFDKVTEQSVLRSLEIIQSQLGSHWAAAKTQNQCIRCIVSVIEGAAPAMRMKIVIRSMELVEDVIDKVKSRTSKQEQNKQNMEILSHLAISTYLRQSIIVRLVDEVKVFTDELRQVARGQHKLDFQHFNNSFYLVNALGKCVGLPMDKQDGFIENIRGRLEDSLLHLTDTFPLFSHEIWNIMSKLQ